MSASPVRLAAPIGQPLPIMQPVASTADAEAWGHNYGRAWSHTPGETPPAASRWRIERLERFGDGHRSTPHMIGIASVDGDDSGDVLMVYDTNYRAEIWRAPRAQAEEMWPRLVDHARQHAPNREAVQSARASEVVEVLMPATMARKIILGIGVALCLLAAFGVEVGPATLFQLGVAVCFASFLIP